MGDVVRYVYSELQYKYGLDTSTAVRTDSRRYLNITGLLRNEVSRTGNT